jgi:hypothetical protein
MAVLLRAARPACAFSYTVCRFSFNCKPLFFISSQNSLAWLDCGATVQLPEPLEADGQLPEASEQANRNIEEGSVAINTPANGERMAKEGAPKLDRPANESS